MKKIIRGSTLVLIAYALCGCAVAAEEKTMTTANERCDGGKTDEEWKQILSPEAYRVLREHATEPAFTGKYLHNKEDGVYRCASCGEPLFSSGEKYDSGTGWPSFRQPIDKEAVGEKVDRSLLMVRTEVHCKRCGGHLGHVFDDGPGPNGLRYCINSVSLHFKPEE